MTPLRQLRRHGPKALKHLSFGGGAGFVQSPFWLNDDLRARVNIPMSSDSTRERIESSFEGYVTHALKANAVVFACFLARQLPFSEALFRYQAMNDGTPGSLSFGPGLELLEKPWPNGTTGELLSRMEQDASLAGNSFWTPITTAGTGRLRRLRPDWVTIVSGVRDDPDLDATELDADVLGYIYHPVARGGRRRPEPVFLTVDRVAHYSPIPDPAAQWRGMSWLTPVVQEIMGDSAVTRHKLKYFENAAVSPYAVVYDPAVNEETFKAFVKLFREEHEGLSNAYKTVHLGGGADVKAIGADLKQLDFKAMQGGGETRIAAAAGCGAIIGQLQESLNSAGLMQGNYNAAKRRYADMLLRPLWRTAAGSLEKFTQPPEGDRLWYADRHIDFLQEDAGDAAKIFQQKAASIRTLTDGGYEPRSVIAAVDAEDVNLLEHTGKTPVQLHDPNAVLTDDDPDDGDEGDPDDDTDPDDGGS